MAPFNDVQHTTHLQTDSAPTSGSNNLITSGTVATSLATKMDTAGGTFTGDITFSKSTGQMTFYDSGQDHEHGKILVEADGITGARCEIHTREIGGSVQKRFTISGRGALGIGVGPDYGASGRVLTSQGGANPPVRTDSATFTNTTITNDLNVDHDLIVDGEVGIGTTSPDFPLDVNGNMRVGTTDGGYIYWLRGSSYGNRISIRGNYLGSDRYILEFRVRGFPNAPAMYLQRNGGGNPFLRVNGQQSFGSDNRLKHNEVNLVNALDTINRLQPKVYDKTAEMLDENYNGPLEEGTYNKEVGFIAQEVYEINELKEFVDVGDENEPWGVNYNALFSYNIGATQELHSLIKAQQAQIDTLTLKLNQVIAQLG